MKNLKDSDYVLAENAAWLEVGGFAVRLAYQGETLAVGVYRNGREDEDPVFAIELQDEQGE